MKFTFISTEKALFGVAYLCRQLRVSRSGYYAWVQRGESRRAREDRRLVPLIKAEFACHPRGCGSRTITHALRQQGRPVSRKRIVRLMSQEKLRPRLKRRFVRTTDSRHQAPVAANVLARSFCAGPPDCAWAGDITYVPTKRGWAYLAVLLDVGSRKVVGWKVGPKIDQQLVLRALEMAIEDRNPPAGLVHHTDRGVQYVAEAYQATLARRGIVCSMSRKGDCWDNALAESFFSTLKREILEDTFEDWRDVEQAVFRYIQAYYNTRRRHSALGYMSPNQYEQALAA